MTTSMLKGERVDIKVVGNKIVNTDDYDTIKENLSEKSLEELLLENYILDSDKTGPFFILEDSNFKKALKAVLSESGVI